MFQQLKELRFSDIVTLTGLVCALLSMFFSFSGEFLTAFLLIWGQFIFDGIDGKIARKFGGGKLGVYLDSFSDFTAIIATVFFGWMIGINDMLLIIFGIFFIICAAVRLSYFMSRIDKSKKEFVGVPTVLVVVILTTMVFANYYWQIIDMQFFVVLYLLGGYAMICDLKIKKV